MGATDDEWDRIDAERAAARAAQLEREERKGRREIAGMHVVGPYPDQWDAYPSLWNAQNVVKMEGAGEAVPLHDEPEHEGDVPVLWMHRVISEDGQQARAYSRTRSGIAYYHQAALGEGEVVPLYR
jgi:hypothetical protein